MCTVDSTGQKEDEDTVEETCMKNQSEDRRKNNIRELRNCRKWLNKKKKKIVLITKSLDFCFFFFIFLFAIFEILITTTIQNEGKREKKSKATHIMPCCDCDKSLCACAPRLTHARLRPLAQPTRKLSVRQSFIQSFSQSGRGLMLYVCVRKCASVCCFH